MFRFVAEGWFLELNRHIALGPGVCGTCVRREAILLDSRKTGQKEAEAKAVEILSKMDKDGEWYGDPKIVYEVRIIRSEPSKE